LKIRNEIDLLQMVREDLWMMDALHTAKSLELPDWWICAGFVRSKIWDVQHGFTERTPLPDVDVIYFDPVSINEEEEKRLEERLRSLSPNVPWSVKNQARMHVLNNVNPYLSAVDAISKFPETATALGLSLDEQDNLILTAPHGIEDAVNMVLRATPAFSNNPELAPIFQERINKKNWSSRWKQLQIYSGIL